MPSETFNLDSALIAFRKARNATASIHACGYVHGPNPIPQGIMIEVLEGISALGDLVRECRRLGLTSEAEEVQQNLNGIEQELSEIMATKAKNQGVIRC